MNPHWLSVSRTNHLRQHRSAIAPAIIPAIKGRAWITGFSTYLLDPDDPYPEGYILSDSWGVTGTMTQ